jgi:hypothetical protein
MFLFAKSPGLKYGPDIMGIKKTPGIIVQTSGNAIILNEKPAEAGF